MTMKVKTKVKAGFRVEIEGLDVGMFQE